MNVLRQLMRDNVGSLAIGFGLGVWIARQHPESFGVLVFGMASLGFGALLKLLIWHRVYHGKPDCEKYLRNE
jgi:hypothetical protein